MEKSPQKNQSLKKALSPKNVKLKVLAKESELFCIDENIKPNEDNNDIDSIEKNLNTDNEIECNKMQNTQKKDIFRFSFMKSLNPLNIFISKEKKSPKKTCETTNKNKSEKTSPSKKNDKQYLNIKNNL